jgi:hypothetical protein
MAVGGQEDAGAVEEAVGLVEVGAAHRQIPRIHGVAQGHRALDAGRQLPAVLVELGGRDGLAAASADRLTMLRANSRIM